MSNHLTPIDQLTRKLNEVIHALNNCCAIHDRVEPLVPWGQSEDPPSAPVNYPDYNRSIVDHSTLGG